MHIPPALFKWGFPKAKSPLEGGAGGCMCWKMPTKKARKAQNLAG